MGMARGTERLQAVEVEVRAPWGTLHFGFVSQNTIASFFYKRSDLCSLLAGDGSQSLLSAWHGWPR